MKNAKTKAIILIAVVLLVIILAAVWINGTRKSGHGDTSSSLAAQESGQDQKTAFPAEIDDQNLRIDSLFQFTGVNPDAGDVDCEDVAAIQLTNQSGKYLKQAQIEITLVDGSTLAFHVQDVPDQAEIYAFDTTNQTCTQTDGIKAIQATADYTEEEDFLGKTVIAKVQDINIRLTSKGSEDLSDLQIIYHCSMDNILFGGISYTAKLDKLKAGAKASLKADQAWLGEAAVTRIESGAK